MNLSDYLSAPPFIRTFLNLCPLQYFLEQYSLPQGYLCYLRRSDEMPKEKVRIIFPYQIQLVGHPPGKYPVCFKQSVNLSRTRYS